MKRYLAVAVFMIVSVWGVNAHAQQETGDKGKGTGFYGGGHLVLNILSDPDFELAGLVLSTNYDPGASLGGFWGYEFGNFRVDGELAIRINKINSLNGAPIDGDTSAFSYMVNGYFDFPTNGPVKPYIGGGIGFATVSIDWHVPGFFPFSQVSIADDSDSGVAYQFSAGIGYEINPRTTVSFGYRYFATEELQMMFDSGTPFTMEYQSHEFNLVVRYMFN